MKNSDKILFAVAAVACLGGCAAYFLVAPSQKKSGAKKTPSGAEVAAWTDAGAASADAVPAVWKAPAFDTAEGWNYDLFSAPEISWDAKQKKYFAKELPPPPEEVFGLTLKSISNPTFRLVISSYLSGTKPVPEKREDGRYAAVLSVSDVSSSPAKTRMINFASADMALEDTTDASGARVVMLVPESPLTIPGTNAKLKSFRIRQKTDPATGMFRETLDAVVIDESGRAPREIVIGTNPKAKDADRVEAVFSDGFTEWRYSETRAPGGKGIVREIARRNSPSEPFSFVESGNEIRIGGDVFRIKNLDISSEEARIEKQSSELDKKTKAPKTTERVLSPEG